MYAAKTPTRQDIQDIMCLVSPRALHISQYALETLLYRGPSVVSHSASHLYRRNADNKVDAEGDSTKGPVEKVCRVHWLL
jgi:hypothetical protein